MTAIFFNGLWRSRYLILGWGLGFGLFGMWLIGFYDDLAGQRAVIDQLVESFPPGMLAFFGNVESFSTPEGYLSLEFFSYIPVIFGILATSLGAAVISAAEENGTLDLLLAHPLQRGAYFIGRFLAMIVALAVVMLLTWLGSIIALNWTNIDLTAAELFRPFMSLGAFIIAFAAFATFLSQFLPSQAGSSLTAAFILVASYIFSSMANIDERLQEAVKFSPYTYFQGADAINGINMTWLLGSLSATLLFGGLAWWRFEKRDIRIGGEGGWESLIALMALRKKNPKK
jgi:ABC-2 type transport system permease protein